MGTVSFQDYPNVSMDFKDVEIEKIPEIITAYWVDADGKKATKLPYGTDTIGIYIKGKNLSGKEAKIRVFDSDWGPFNDDHIIDIKEKLTGDEKVIPLDFTEKHFVEGEKADDFHNDNTEDSLQLYFTIEIEDYIKEEYCNEDEEQLNVHVVKYIPRIMKKIGWEMGFALQEEWFARKSNEKPQENEPLMNVITMDWVLGFSRAKEVYDSLVSSTQKLWVSKLGKKALIQEIKRMIEDGHVSLPRKIHETSPFGVVKQNVVNYEHSSKGKMQVPLFDKYHYQEKEFEESLFDTFWNNKLDDLYAALANFVFRMCSSGTITRNNNSYTISVKKVHVYVRDSFDFIDDGLLMSQPLGYWNIAGQEVNARPKYGHRLIKNSSYQEYRKEFDKGGDFILFSDLKSIDVQDSFNVSLSDLV